MGSSCFARGNSQVLSAIEGYISENNLEDRVEFEGHLCLGRCNSGPHVSINGKEYSALDADCIIDLLKAELE
ncbi:MAG TPA: NAD(P)H-dependent oxidoreductase subunit E [Candidatus Ornithospirochaeta avicola]|uniref:NAD(P)H-dependent oxidoreductase subunit E n=1 Tax=Candidatus Ornithospirochaeta avicola TaxID=2840896 RepID=A0A9D1PU84_9SPIO|nr:NAD(P)H-dependent oxidoreductase subunit E [Candidatus Ornithospirochaeta avicola]